MDPWSSDIPRNILANKTTKEATSIITNTILPVSFLSPIQVINEMICDSPPTKECVMQIYQHQVASQNSKQTKNRKEDALLARLWSTRNPSLNHYLH